MNSQSDVNTVTLSGHVGKEIRNGTFGRDNRTFCQFTIRVHHEYQSRFGQKSQNEFFDVVAFGATGDWCLQYLAPESHIRIEGRLKNGNSYKTSVQATKVDFVTKPWACTKCGITEQGFVTHTINGFEPVVCEKCREEGVNNG